MDMRQVAGIVWKECMALEPGEKALVVTDPDLEDIASALMESGIGLCKSCSMLVMKKAKIHGQEPPEDVVQAMLEADAVIAPTSFSITHTKATRLAAEQGARVITMPGITREMFLRAIPLDYRKLKKDGERLRDTLEATKEMNIETKHGTDLYLVQEGRKIRNLCGLVREMRKPVTNLPDGEVCFSPLEGRSEGKVVIDLSAGPDSQTKFGVIGRVRRPFRILVEKGELVDCENPVLWKWVTSVENGANLAELGIGTNPKAVITGRILEDEKVKGTAHVAFGTSKSSLGGKVQSSIHLDCVFSKPSISVDGKVIIKDGKF